MEANPYAPPVAVVAAFDAPETELAGRGRRLLAWFIDTVCLGVAWAIAEWALSLAGIEFAVDESDAGSWEWLWTLDVASNAMGFALFLALQGPLLATRAQTIGKLLLQMRIVDRAGMRGSFARIILRRELPGWLANMTVGLGLAYFLVDVLFIFRRDRRCLHDLIAGTQVVVAR